MKLSALWSRQTPHTSTIILGRPAPVPGRSGLAVVAIMKDEARHIEDWIRFHALAGVRDFFLYDDGSTDGSRERARAIANVNITILPWRLTAQLDSPRVGFSRQVMAYCHAIENFGGAFRWMAFIDIDEYIVPKQGTSILSVLDGLDGFTNISLPWTMFGPNGHETVPQDAAPYAYTTRGAARAGPLLNFKCIIDPTDVIEARVHRFRTVAMGRTSVNDVGKVSHYKKRASPQFLSDAELQLNHYYTRSRQELTEKLAKGAVSASPLDRRNQKVTEKLDIIEATAIEDRSAPDFLGKIGISDTTTFRARDVAIPNIGRNA